MAAGHSESSLHSELAKLREDIALLKWTNEELLEKNEQLRQENVSLYDQIGWMSQQVNGSDHAGLDDPVATEDWQHDEQADPETDTEQQDGSDQDHDWDVDDDNQVAGEDDNHIAGEEEEYTEEHNVQEEDPNMTNRWDVTEPTQDNRVCTACVAWEIEREAIEQEPSTDPQEVFLNGEFFETPAAVVWLPWEDQYSALHKAHQIAKQAFWYAYRYHWPEKALDKFPWHWDQVRFGTSEIQMSGLGTKQFPDASLSMCDQTRDTVCYSMSLVTELRNAVCHPAGPLPVSQICSHIGHAEKLAKLLGDRARVHELRMLRWDVMRKAQDVYKRIEASVGTAWCTGPRRSDTKLQCNAQTAFAQGEKHTAPVSRDNAPWPFHIQYLLQQVTNGLDKHSGRRWEFEAYPHAILEAARLWSAKGLRPGEDDPDYDERVQAAHARVKNAATELTVVEADPVHEDPSESAAESCTHTPGEATFTAVSADEYSEWLYSLYAPQLAESYAGFLLLK